MIIDLECVTDLILEKIAYGEKYIYLVEELVTELKAAREVVEYFRDWNNDHTDSCNRDPCDCGYDEAIRTLKTYDEARRG